MTLQKKHFQIGIRGFTLVEMLVVIAIIMLCIALALPVMRSVTASAKRATCASNLRQLYHGFVMYTNENRNTLPYCDWSGWENSPEENPEMYPGDVDWLGYWVGVYNIPEGGTIWPYIREAEVYKCPEDTGERLGRWIPEVPHDWGCWTPVPGVHSYSMPISRECKQLTPAISDKALLVDESGTTINDGGFTSDWDALASRHRLSGFGIQTEDKLKNAGGNILFCDGRVEFFTSESVVKAEDPIFK